MQLKTPNIHKTNATTKKSLNGWLLLNFVLLITLIAMCCVPSLKGYFRVVTFYPIGLVWLLTTLFININWLKRIKPLMIIILIYLVLIILRTLINSDTTILHRFIAFHFIFLVWPIIFMFVSRNYTNMMLKWLWRISIIFFLIGSITTFMGLHEYPMAARLLAGAASVEENFKYSALGIGGYGFIYGLVFLAPVMLYRALQIKNAPLFFIINFIILVIFLVTIIKADYSVALILMLILVCIILINRFVGKRRVLTLWILIISTTICYVNKIKIMQFLYEIFSNSGNKYITIRLQQLLTAMQYNSFDNLRRIQLYNESLGTMSLHPIIGGAWFDNVTIGGHSELLDNFAYYGVMGLWLIGFILVSFKRQTEYVNASDIFVLKTLQWSFIAFGLIDTFLTSPEIAVVMFLIVPLTLTPIILQNRGYRLIR